MEEEKKDLEEKMENLLGGLVGKRGKGGSGEGEEVVGGGLLEGLLEFEKQLKEMDTQVFFLAFFALFFSVSSSHSPFPQRAFLRGDGEGSEEETEEGAGEGGWIENILDDLKIGKEREKELEV